MPVTIRDVAKRLNLSITTISRALDGYDDVAEETRQLVVRTAQEMGYSPSLVARRLRRKRADAIGFIIPNETPSYSDPFFSEFIAGLGEEANSNEYDLLVSSAPAGGENEQAVYQRWIRARKVDGFVLNRLRYKDWRVQYLSANDIPFVTLQRTSDEVNYASIEVDGRAGFRRMVHQLHARGHTRFAYVGGPADLVIQIDRLTGFQEGLKDLNLTSEPDRLIESDLTYLGGLIAGTKLLEYADPPTAILCIDDQTATGVLEAAFRKGLKVGTDLAVTGFDGIREGMHTSPPLTTFDQSIHQVARTLARLLINLINSVPLGEQNRKIQPELILRASSESLPNNQPSLWNERNSSGGED